MEHQADDRQPVALSVESYRESAGVRREKSFPVRPNSDERGRIKPVVFVSHAHEDQSIATRLKDWLGDRLLGGVEVFVSSDGASIRGGEQWMERIETSLRASRLILVLCTPNSIHKPWLFFEAGGAFFLGSLVVPLCAAGLAKQDLGVPLSLLQAYDLQKPEDLALLMTQIAEYAGLRVPSFDPPADSVWITQGDRIELAASNPSEPSRETHRPLSLKEVDELITEIDPDIQTAAAMWLLAYELTFDNSALIAPPSYDSDGLPLLARSASWAWHIEKLAARAQLAEIPVRDSATLAKHLRKIVAENGWSPVNALLEVEALMPTVVPSVLREFLLLDRLEAHHWVGWRMQLELASLVRYEGGDLLLRACATSLRISDFAYSDSYVDGLIRIAKALLQDEVAFEEWFRQIAHREYSGWKRDRQAYEDEWRRRLENETPQSALEKLIKAEKTKD